MNPEISKFREDTIHMDLVAFWIVGYQNPAPPPKQFRVKEL